MSPAKRSPRKLRFDKRKHPLNVKLVLLALTALLVAVQLGLIVNYRISSNLNYSSDVSAASIDTQNKQSKTVAKEKLLEQATIQSKDEQKKLPKWIQDYFAWHREMRSKFPGASLFTDPDAPPLLIRTCLGLCGGLNDRLGQLPWDLYLANQTKRVYLIRWERPKPLEEFLVPTGEIDWMVPEGVAGFGDMLSVRAIPRLFEGYDEERPEDDFWSNHLDEGLKRAITGELKDTKVLRHRFLGHLKEEILEERLRALGETDMIHSTQTFGNIFRAFFKPSKEVEEELNQVYRDLGITPGHYTAVHCRVRHPKATVHGVIVRGKNANYPADKSGLPWYGETKDFAVAVGTHAIQCARTLSSDKQEPIYFMSDSNDLVRYVAHELTNSSFVTKNATLFDNKHDTAALKAVESANIVAREVSLENVHIDKQKGRSAEAYYGTFVDLLLAANARCVTFGIGYYAIFATKISGTECKLLTQEEEWGRHVGGKKAAELCTEETYTHIVT